MRGRGKEQCAVAHTAVWVRLVVLVVLTARLSLPGGAELKKLGRSGCGWEVVAKYAANSPSAV